MTKAPLPFSESGAFQLVKKSLFDKLVDAGEQAPPRQMPRLKSSI